jgi:GMP synthase (glutamine-hydrolysing)
VKPVVILQHEADDPPGSIRVALRALRIPYEIRRLDMGDDVPAWPDELSALIALGGAMHVTQERDYPFLAAEKALMRRMLHQGAPVWGICLGAQVLTLAAGGEVFRRRKPEVGWITIAKQADDALLRGVASPFAAFEWHQYSCTLPPTAHLVADGDEGIQAYRAGGRAWATQFHPEVDVAMMQHWLDDAVAKHPEQGPDFAARLRADTDRLLPGYPAFCKTLVENFLRTSGLLDEKKKGGGA